MIGINSPKASCFPVEAYTYHWEEPSLTLRSSAASKQRLTPALNRTTTANSAVAAG
jgi:hypothetical protein